ncbi:MAG TPA: flagellar biosynthesis protein FlhB [Candidatus Cybelea sp.]|nr:flagellar biosynthesis protein FlhB [Candidatus Cybelea sp.]
MADEQDQSQKTEDPTQKRIDEAEKEGQIARSQELNYWFLLLGAALVTLLFAAPIAGKVARLTLPYLASVEDIAVDPGHLGDALSHLAMAIGLMVLPALVIMGVASLSGTLVQHRPVISFEVLKPKFDRFNLIEGFKRLGSVRGGVEFLKNLLKLAIVGGVAVLIVWPKIELLPMMVTYDPVSILATAQHLALAMLGAIVGIMTVIAGADVFYQKWDLLRRLRMSKQELRDESRQNEGDPAIKARIKSIRAERSRKRMMAAVPAADVVIANPTHFAIALKYDGATMQAPKVLAKGQDLIALRIREIAEENKVPVVENPPLARALYGACEVDREIPVEHYRAVAEVIGYVMRLKSKRIAPARTRPRP